MEYRMFVSTLQLLKYNLYLLSCQRIKVCIAFTTQADFVHLNALVMGLLPVHSYIRAVRCWECWVCYHLSCLVKSSEAILCGLVTSCLQKFIFYSTPCY